MEKNLEDMEKPELIAIIYELLRRVSALETRIKQDSRNSSKPPSSDMFKKTVNRSLRKTSGRKPGGQFGHKGSGLTLPHEPDNIVELVPETCVHCGHDLSECVGRVIDTHHKIDVQINVVVTAFEQTESVCPECGEVTIAEFPENLRGTKQYGEGVGAIAVMLNQYANVSMDKTQKILADVFDVPLSVGTVSNIIDRCAGNCEPTLEHIKAKLQAGDILHCDETSVRVNGKNNWLHTASSKEYTYNTISEKRGSVGTNENGVLQGFGGTAVHDCWSPYFNYDNCSHALCNAHLLRELNAVIENDGFEWATRMKALICEMKSVTDKYKDNDRDYLSKYYATKFDMLYNDILAQGEQESPRTETKKQTKARNLLERFIKYREEVTRFTADFAVPFDNNQAERDIRSAKVKMKVSGGFRSDKGAKNFGKIGSVIGTVVKQGANVLNALKNVITDNSVVVN